MREIRLRGWDTVHKDMKEVAAINWIDETVLLWHQRGNIRITIDRSLDAIVLMQYIGVRDKYGREIYEGDIIQTYFSFKPGDAGYGMSQKPFVVKWEQGRSGFRAYKPNAKSRHLLDTIDFFEMQSNLYEVIGNRFEHPELLEKEKAR